MIQVVLYDKKGMLCGFEIIGHSTVSFDDNEGKLICSAVSSAALMTANTVTEIIGDNSEVECSDGKLRLICFDCEACMSTLEGFKLHIIGLANEYPERIKVKTEVI